MTCKRSFIDYSAISPFQLENTFEVALKKELGLDIRQMETDGSCLFRAIGRLLLLSINLAMKEAAPHLCKSDNIRTNWCSAYNI